MVYAAPDQKAERIARLLAEEVVPFCGVPEAVLSDRGTNLLSHLVQDVCRLLGIKKLNTTSYHPQCDGMVERLNRTLKAMLRKHASQFGTQWDTYLSGVVWAYRNTIHESTGEKPSFLLFGMDLRTPIEAALLSPNPLESVSVSDYRQQLILSLSSARQNAAVCVRKAQHKYKKSYNRKATTRPYQVGDWVMVRFPAEETGKQRKLSQPWHGPYRVVTIRDPDIVATKVYFPKEDTINVHQLRVTRCPVDFPAGYYWYGRKQRSPGKIPRWWLEDISDEGSVARPATVINDTSDDMSGDINGTSDDMSGDISDTSGADVNQADSGDTDHNMTDDIMDQDLHLAEMFDVMTEPRSNSRYSLRTRVKLPARFQ